MNTSKDQKKAYLLALLAVLFWSTMSSAFNITLRYIAFDQLLLWTSLSGMITLFIVNRFGKKKLEFSKITKKQFLSSALLGLFNPFLYYIILFKAYELLEAQVAGTLNYIWPVVLVLMSIPLLGQRIKGLRILAIFISFFGLVIISTHGDLITFKLANPLGVGLAVGSAIFWALYWIFNMKDDREETGKIFLNLTFGFIYIFIYLLITSGIQTPSPEAILGAIYIGMFEMSITFVIWLKALQYSSNTAKVSNLIYLSPFIALFFIRYAVGEKIHLATIIGLAFIIAGIILQQFIRDKQEKNEIKST